ncbi:MAG: class I SAM-dependent methyltransferase [Pirellulales bacterium]
MINGDGWLGDSIVGKDVCVLAAGGGRHGPLYAAAGAIATVVDLSPADVGALIAAWRPNELDVRIVETSMEDLSMFATGEFDVVVQPVSTCYVPDIAVVYRQVARILPPWRSVCESA